MNTCRYRIDFSRLSVSNSFISEIYIQNVLYCPFEGLEIKKKDKRHELQNVYF